ncbi:MAG: hypothetical protein KDA53_00945 [Hyphomonas sp.]|nr:hypothetical protein [Hyphomonas sp.]
MFASTGPTQDARRRERFTTEIRGWFMPEGRTVGHQVQVCNVSQDGAKLKFDFRPDRIGRFRLGLILDDGQVPHYVECEWRWQAQDSVGAKFLTPLPLGVLQRVLADAGASGSFL